MILIEMELWDGNAIDGSMMFNVEKISEVEELNDSVRLYMVSGNSYVVTAKSFESVVNGIEGLQYMKLNRNPEAEAETVEEVEEVEGELVEE